MGWLETIGQGLRAVAEIFGWAKQRDAEKNTPEIQANVKGADDAKIVDKARSDVAEGDADAIRKGLS